MSKIFVVAYSTWEEGIKIEIILAPDWKSAAILSGAGLDSDTVSECETIEDLKQCACDIDSDIDVVELPS